MTQHALPITPKASASLTTAVCFPPLIQCGEGRTRYIWWKMFQHLGEEIQSIGGVEVKTRR